MDRRTIRILRAALLGSLIATLPAVAQNGPPAQSRPAPGGRPGGSPGGGAPGGRPQQPPNQGRPGGSPGQGRPGGTPNQGRPGGPPNQGRPGGPQIQPHPNPGQPGRPQPGRPQPGPRPPNTRPPQHRPPQWGRPPAKRPTWGYRPGDRDYFRRYYGPRLGYVNRARRPVFVVGGFIPFGDLGYFSPLPPSLYGYLPPIPPGYQVSYWDGYVVVYDPMTGYILSVMDLM